MNVDLVELLKHPSCILFIILVLDLVFGDPVYRFHPVRLIGRLISLFEAWLRHSRMNGKLGGILLSLLLISITSLFSMGIFKLLEHFHWSLGWVWHVFLGWSFIALGDLLKHSRQVAIAMEKEDLLLSQVAVGKLVGRDTNMMDLPACGRATVESVGENFNDGVLAPIFYFCLFGISGTLIYKVVNTLDSMVGYRNEQYQEFGWCSAKIDDLMSFIPARISWLLLSITAIFYPQLSGSNAFKTGWKDHFKLTSFNAGWCEATVAGALKIKLCGPIWRDGRLAQNVWIGRKSDRVGATVKDIKAVNSLALSSSLIGSGFTIIILYYFQFPTFFN